MFVGTVGLKLPGAPCRETSHALDKYHNAQHSRLLQAADHVHHQSEDASIPDSAATIPRSSSGHTQCQSKHRWVMGPRPCMNIASRTITGALYEGLHAERNKTIQNPSSKSLAKTSRNVEGLRDAQEHCTGNRASHAYAACSGLSIHDFALPIVSFTRPRSASPTMVASPVPPSTSAWGARSVRGVLWTSACPNAQMSQHFPAVATGPCQLVGEGLGMLLLQKPSVYQEDNSMIWCAFRAEAKAKQWGMSKPATHACGLPHFLRPSEPCCHSLLRTASVIMQAAAPSVPLCGRSRDGMPKLIELSC